MLSANGVLLFPLEHPCHDGSPRTRPDGDAKGVLSFITLAFRITWEGCKQCGLPLCLTGVTDRV